MYPGGYARFRTSLRYLLHVARKKSTSLALWQFIWHVSYAFCALPIGHMHATLIAMGLAMLKTLAHSSAMTIKTVIKCVRLTFAWMIRSLLSPGVVWNVVTSLLDRKDLDDLKRCRNRKFYTIVAVIMERKKTFRPLWNNIKRCSAPFESY